MQERVGRERTSSTHPRGDMRLLHVVAEHRESIGGQNLDRQLSLLPDANVSADDDDGGS